MIENYSNYDKIADEVFGPIYADIADCMLERTGITSGSVLDIGCGGGHMGFAVMQKGGFTDCAFCDIRPETELLVSRRAAVLGMEGKVRHVVCDVHSMPFADRSFDLIVSRGSMPFWTDQIAAFTEIHRVLREGGWAYIGGGLGGKKHAERIKAAMGENGGCKCCSRENSLALTTQDYIDLFERLGCTWKVVENDDEGRWFLFRRETR